MADMPSSVRCRCGSDAVRVIGSLPDLFVANREYVFDKRNCVVNFGKDYGRGVRRQHKHYQDYIEGMKKHKRAIAGSKLKKTGMEWLGTMPGEMVDSIGLHEGDPEAVAKDPVKFLKKTNLYQGD